MQERRTTRRVSVHLPVEHIISDVDACDCVTTELSLDGLRLAKAPGASWGNPRHVWLQLQLPDAAGGPIRALAERRHDVEHITEARDVLDNDAQRGFLIKYIYPRDRRRYEAFVRAVMERAPAGRV